MALIFDLVNFQALVNSIKIKMENYGLIILAAGGSLRLGTPKQLLQYKSQSLLKKIVRIAVEVEPNNSLVVIGAQKESMQKELAQTGIAIAVNNNWQQGMSSSIKIGLTQLLKSNAALGGCIFSVCDQPFITAGLLQNLIKKHQQSSKGIIAAAYAGIFGTPVLLDKKYFEDLMHLQNDEGAKKILHKYNHDLATIPFEGGEVDIDTKEDYKKLIDVDR